MIRLGLIGFPLDHSFSQGLHERALRTSGLEGTYRLWEVPPLPRGREKLLGILDLLREEKIRGINVTIPHKESILPFIDRLTPTAWAVGAVNTLYLHPDRGWLIGENTDSPGFWADAQRGLGQGEDGGERRALVLGAGGAARAVIHALITRGWSVCVAARRTSQAECVSRHFAGQGRAVDACHLSEQVWCGMEDCRLIVNATPVGMAPDTDCSPWPSTWEFPRTGMVYDLVYNPPQTEFMKQAEEQGLEVRNGSGMLVEQAALAFRYWTGVEPPRKELLDVIHSKAAE